MLYIVSTPIGNLQDITLRALKVLEEADFILAEDTRKTQNLLKNFGLKKKVISFYEYNESRRIPRVVEELKKGVSAALVSSAGTPTISDPGYKLVRACRSESLAVTSVPGPSSIINALSLSSLSHEKFIFIGYMPRKASARSKLIGRLKGLDMPVLFLESPYRILSCLEDLFDICGDRMITVAREMTKKFEDVRELSIRQALEYFRENRPRGEFTVLLESIPES